MRLLNQSLNQIAKVMRLTPLLLIALLTSCANKSPVVTTCSKVPVAYLSHLDKTVFAGETYGDIAQYSVILKRERDMCLNRIEKIREWQTEKLSK